MPTYYDEKQKTWYCKFYYQDYTGTKKQKLKRGFKLQREAKAWERDFLEKQAGSPDMTFQALYDLYIEDVTARLKESSVRVKNCCITKNILPYFKDKPLNQITAADVRAWQNQIIALNIKETTQRNIFNQLNAMLNFAGRYYDLKANPCKVTGAIGKNKAGRMDFWTVEEFNSFIAAVDDPQYHVFFDILYYSGLRMGEVLALTPADVDLDGHSISVTKTYHRLHGKDLFTTPKTANSVRKVTIPEFLCDEIRSYEKRIYGLKNTDRLLPLSRNPLHRAMTQYCICAKVKQIRVHDIRHSHVSLLIELGFQPMLIAERIGDTVAMVNNIYGHLYPNKHNEVADRLQQLKRS